MRGVLLTEGEVWRDQRRFALHVLRNFGMGKNLMQERVSLFSQRLNLKKTTPPIRTEVSECRP